MQLVELQESLNDLDDTAVIAVSYDPVETLASFAAQYDITYPLLSDLGSEAISLLGLVNDLAVEDSAYWGRTPSDRHRNLTWPGTFLLDEDGLVVSKRFERSHRNRPTVETLLDSDGRAQLTATGSGPGLTMRASTRKTSYFANQVFPVRLLLVVQPRMHLYVDPVPNGYQPLKITIDGPAGAYWESPAIPDGEPFTIEALAETFQVIDGSHELEIPMHLHESLATAEFEVVVRYQACDDTTCTPPTEIRARIALTVRPKL